MKEGDCYHAFILTPDRKMYEGAATKTGDKMEDGFYVGLNMIQHPNIDEKKLAMEMTHVLVDFSKKFIPLDGEE